MGHGIPCGIVNTSNQGQSVASSHMTWFCFQTYRVPVAVASVIAFSKGLCPDDLNCWFHGISCGMGNTLNQTESVESSDMSWCCFRTFCSFSMCVDFNSSSIFPLSSVRVTQQSMLSSVQTRMSCVRIHNSFEPQFFRMISNPNSSQSFRTQIPIINEYPRKSLSGDFHCSPLQLHKSVFVFSVRPSQRSWTFHPVHVKYHCFSKMKINCITNTSANCHPPLCNLINAVWVGGVLHGESGRGCEHTGKLGSSTQASWAHQDRNLWFRYVL
jgi:hypothetical protein